MGQVVTLPQLLQALEPLRGKRAIVTTNGCFDLLHVGHLRYLQAARAEGDCLVLLLNTDASVRRLKGPNRPIVPQDERAELLAGLTCVDYVVLFEDDTPEALLKAIGPDVHVKGAQYTEATLPEAETLRTLGTRMAFVTMVEGRSTTNIIERIVQLEAAC